MPIPSEQSAYGAMTALEELNTLDLKPNLTPDELTRRAALQFQRDRLTTDLDTYVTQRRARGLPLFPETTAKANQARDTFVRNLHTKAPADFLPADQAAKLDAAARLTPDPEAFTKRELNRAYLSVLTGKELDGESYNLTRDAYAAQHLGVAGGMDDKAFHAAIAARYARDDAAAATTAKLANDAYLATIRGNDVDRAPFQAHFKTLPSELMAGASEQYRAAIDEARQARRRLAPVVNAIRPVVERLMGEQSDAIEYASRESDIRFNIVALADQLPDDPRERDLAVAILASDLAKLPQPVRSTAIRASDAVFRTINQLFEGGKQISYTLEDLIRDTATAPFTPDNLAAQARAKDTPLKNHLTLRTKVAVLKDALLNKGGALDLAEPGDTWATRSAIGFASSLPYTFLAVTPYGVGAMAAGMAGEADQRTRIETPDAKPLARVAAAAVSGTAQAWVETAFDRFGVAVLRGKAPTLTALLNRAAVTSRAGRAALGATFGGVAVMAGETTEEITQAAIAESMQAAAAELSGIQPNVNWSAFLQSWAPGGEKLADTLLAVAPFAILAAGGSAVKHVRNGEFYLRNVALMRAAGLTTEETAQVINAPTPEAAQQALAANFAAAQARPLTEEQQAEQAELRKAALANLKARSEELSAGGVPVISEEFNDFTGETQWIFTDRATNTQTIHETEEAALDAFRDWALNQNLDAVHTLTEAARVPFIDFLTGEGQAAEGINVNDTGKSRTLATDQAESEADLAAAEKQSLTATTAAARADAATRAEAARRRISAITSRFKVFLRDRRISPAAGAELFKSIAIRAASFPEMLRGKIVGWTVNLYQGHTIQDITEDVSETVLKRAIADGFADPHRILDDIRAYERATGADLLEADYDPDADPVPLIEAFSKLARGYLFAESRSTDSLPAEVRQWVDFVTAFSAATVDLANSQAWEIMSDVSTAAQIRAAVAAGTMPVSLRNRLADATGLNDTERAFRLQKQMEEQLAAEAMEGFPEIGSEARGMLPHPATPGVQFAGELRRIWEALLKPTRRRSKTGREIDRTNEANAYFLPVGEKADLDQVRRILNQQGFSFDTPADLLEAVERSIAYNKPTYATQSPDFGQETFAIAQLSETDRSKLIELGEDGYIEAVNKSGKWHPSDAYSTTANQLAQTVKIEEYDELIETVDGIEYRVENRPLQYVATDADGDIIRDEFGNATYYSQVEAKAKNLPPARRDMAAFLDGLPVGVAQDEWGAVLVMVANEYQGKGIGPRLATYYRTEHPFKDSGGFTNAGLNQIRKVYRYLIGTSEPKTIGKPIPLAHRPISSETVDISDIYVVDMKSPAWSRRVYWTSDGVERWLSTTDDIIEKVGADKLARDQQADILIEAEQNATQSPTYALSLPGTLTLDKMLVRLASQGPDARAEYYAKLRDRLASTILMLKETKRNVATDQTDAERERNRIRDALTEAQAIIAALPPEARAHVRMPVADILKADTERGQIGALVRLIAQADEALETALVTEYRAAFETLLDLAKPDLRQNKQLRGRLTPETQRLISIIQEIVTLDPDQHRAAVAATEKSIEETDAIQPDTQEEIDAKDERLTDLAEYLDALTIFGPFVKLDAAGLASALESLRSIYSTGRSARRVVDENEKQRLRQATDEILASLGPVSQTRHAKGKAQDHIILNYLLGMSSFHQVMEFILPKSITARLYQDRVRAADRAFTWDKIHLRERYEALTNRVWNLTGRGRTLARNRIVHELSQIRDDWGITLREGIQTIEEKLEEDQAAAILSGRMKTGWETDRIAMQSLADALADFRLQRLKAQNEERAFSKRVIRFKRVVKRGQPSDYTASHLSAAYLLQLWAQPMYRPALDKYGFTEEIMGQIEAKLDHRAADLLDFMRQEYDAEYDRLNPVYQAIYNMPMPRIRNYAPGVFEHMNAKSGSDAGTIDPEGGAPGVNAMSAGFTKARQHHLARPDDQNNALHQFFAHFESTAYFIHYAEIVRDIRRTLRMPEVRRALNAVHGQKNTTLFFDWLDALEVDGRFRAKEISAISWIGSRILGTRAAVGLSYNLGTIIKQASAATGFLLEMPTKAAMSGLWQGVTSPREYLSAIRTLWNSEPIRQRILDGISPEDRAVLHASADSPSLIVQLLHLGRLPIAYTDAALTSVSGAVAYTYHRNAALAAGASPSAAETAGLSAAARVIERTAQPATTQDKSMAELNPSFFARFLLQFKSDPRQKAAIVFHAVNDFRAGRIGKEELARKLFWGWAVYGLFNAAMADLALSIFRDDDDPDKWTWQDYIASMIAGPLSAIPLLGNTLVNAISFTASKLGGNQRPFAANAPLEDTIDRIPAAVKKTGRLYSELTDGKPGNNPTLNEALTTAQQLAAVLANATGIKPIALAATGLRAVRDVEGLIANTADILTPTADDEALAIAREFKPATQTRDGRAKELDTLERDLLKLDTEARAKRLAKLPAADRATMRRRLNKATMTPSEAQLSRLSKDDRAAAIQKILSTIPESRRPAFLSRLESIGLR
jgi:hypothetical protein